MNIHPAKHGRSGMTRSEVVIVVVVVFGATLLLAFLFGNPLGRRHGKRPQDIKCSNDLKQIGLSFKMWANDHLSDRYPWQVPTNQGGTKEWAFTADVYRHFLVLSNELGSPKVLTCPSDTERIYKSSFDDPALNNDNVSYFVGLSATESGPVMPLAGDRHLVIDNKLRRGVVGLTANQKLSWSERQHKGSGNILFTDGSVRTFSGRQLTKVFLGQSLLASGMTTNWLAIP